jgi:glycosyltransferase involved in cell wall biosynthesis
MAIADAMQAVGESANLRSQLSHRGLLRAAQFRWQTTAQLTAEVLQRYSS